MPEDRQIDPQWTTVDSYLNATLLPDDPTLTAALAANAAAGLPTIDVAPNQGKLLHLLARAQDARRILEIGTLGGYSTIWLARACLPAANSSRSNSTPTTPPPPAPMSPMLASRTASRSASAPPPSASRSSSPSTPPPSTSSSSTPTSPAIRSTSSSRSSSLALAPSCSATTSSATARSPTPTAPTTACRAYAASSRCSAPTRASPRLPYRPSAARAMTASPWPSSSPNHVLAVVVARLRAASACRRS